MNTAERIESMTDDAEFERLATLVLRKADSNFAAIMHLGINAQGKTITSPCDGFCRVPYSDPPLFLWVQHTTERRDGLRSKWLNTREDSLDDLIKAARQAEKLRAKFPNACFTVILSTNQRIPTEPSKPDALAEAVYTKGEELGLEVIIWEQSLYAGFLDTNREGHWFRKEFFGTDAEMLSASLLKELSARSLQEYQKRQFTDPGNWVPRQLDGRVGEYPNDKSHLVKFLVGEVGFGKSAAAYRFLERHIAHGGYGLYIPEGIIQTSYSLEDALRQTLQHLYPTLLPKEVELISNFLPPSSYFAIIVDDVNRTSSPTELIRKLSGWVTAPYMIVCPVWPRFWHAVKDIDAKPSVDGIVIERMSEREGTEAVQRLMRASRREISRIDAYSIAGKLQFDPLLIGSFGKLLRDTQYLNIMAFVENIVEKYIEQCIADAVLVSENKYFEHEYATTLAVLTAHMLRNRDLYPHWNTITSWLQSTPEHLVILRSLCVHGKLCQVSASGDFRFQHDRFLVHFAVNSIVTFLDNRAEYADVLSEPYYAELIGQALLKSPQDPLVLDEIRNKHPLALVTSIHSIGIPTSEYHETIVRKVGEWVSYAGRNSHIPESVRGAVVNSFLNTDSPAVLEIVHTDFGLEVSWLGDWTRFRNGDALGGVYYCRIVGMERSKGSFWEELVEHAKLNHCNMLVEGIKQILASQDYTPDLKKAAIVLIGFLALPELHEVIDEWWRQQANRPASLRVALWATLRCSPSFQEDALLASLITYWNALPDTEEDQQPGYRQDVAERLAQALAPDADVDAINFLITQAQKHPALVSPMASMCGLIDLPDAIEFAVRQCAERDTQEHFSCSVTYWGSSIFPKLSPLSVSRLENMWKNEGNSSSVCKLAFQLWLDNVDEEDTEILGIISEIRSDAPLFRQVLLARARLGDTRCLPDLVSWLNTDTQFFRVAHYVWCDELISVTNQHLRGLEDKTPQDFTGGVLDDHYWLAELITMIPVEHAEKILAANWGYLRYSRLFVQAALCVGTPQSLALADQAIKDWPIEIPLFEHFAFLLGVDRKSKSHRLTLQHFKNLQPYLNLLDDGLLREIGKICYQHGNDWIEWCKNYIPTSVSNQCRKAFRPTDEDLFEQLEMASNHHPNRLLHIMQKFIEQENNSRRFLEILRRWLRTYPTYNNLIRAARCIEEIGSREDVSILNVDPEYDWEKYEANIIRESTRFAICRRTLR